MLENYEALLEALNYASMQHRKQFRKGQEKVPYINHPIQVAHILVAKGQIDDVDLLQAAILHDTVEDTDSTMQDIELLFGESVAKIVSEVTDDKSLSKKERKALQVQNVTKKSHQARCLKLADKCANVYDIVHTPPKGWALERKRDYITWAQSIINQIRNTNDGLEKYFDALCAMAEQHFEEEATKQA